MGKLISREWWSAALGNALRQDLRSGPKKALALSENLRYNRALWLVVRHGDDDSIPLSD